MGEEESHEAFRQIRRADILPTLWLRRRLRLNHLPSVEGTGCGHQFSVTSGTIFAGRKLAMRDYPLAIAIFCNGAYFGGYVKPANWKENRRDRRLRKNQNGKRRVVSGRLCRRNGLAGRPSPRQR